jgi:hypothetical protein
LLDILTLIANPKRLARNKNLNTIRWQNRRSVDQSTGDKPVESELLTVDEAAEILKVSVAGVRRLQHSRKIAFIKESPWTHPGCTSNACRRTVCTNLHMVPPSAPSAFDRVALAAARTVADNRAMPFKDHEKWKVYQRAWAAAKRAENPEPSRIASRKYRAANLAIVREKDRERRRRAKAEEP